MNTTVVKAIDFLKASLQWLTRKGNKDHESLQRVYGIPYPDKEGLKSSSCVILVRRGYWRNKNGKVHDFPTKVTVRCGSVTVRMSYAKLTVKIPVTIFPISQKVLKHRPNA
nr:threonine--tRNA ligase, mitochondrial 1-like [Tanacetum cinerariifolium]